MTKAKAGTNRKTRMTESKTYQQTRMVIKRLISARKESQRTLVLKISSKYVLFINMVKADWHQSLFAFN